MTSRSKFANSPGLRTPPIAANTEGATRRVGVEIEFGDLAARDAATCVRHAFGGTIREVDPHKYLVEDTEFGSFVCELDLRWVHSGYEEFAEEMAEETLRDAWTMVGDITRVLMPTEIAAPPIEYDRLGRFDALVDNLRRMGAKGTHDSLAFAFAVQLNPEVPSFEASSILRYMRAYLLCSDWLRKAIGVHLTRRLLPFINPFPRDYIDMVTNPDYAPSLDRLIDDYLALNPTRNRELDMLPLFRLLDAERVDDALPGMKINARPTFHYRLPDARLDSPDCSVALEWNRWVAVG